MMFVESKLRPPQVRQPFVRRSRLEQKLGDAGERSVTLVSAEAGSGKSALVASWLSDRRYSSAWVSLDREDSNPVRFWTYIIEAVRRELPSLGNRATSMVSSQHNSSWYAVVEEFARELTEAVDARPERFVLVVDDIQKIGRANTIDGFDLFLDLSPKWFQIVVISREDPDISLSRRRVARDVSEIRYDDLRFTTEEAVELCTQLGAGVLSQSDSAVLGKRTEGWVAGIQLAMINVRHHEQPASFVQSFSGDNRFVADYLADEIIDSQSEIVRDFLLKTSELSELNSELCSEVVGNKSASECGKMLLYLERTNMFVVALDDHRELYRYHHLFRDSLRRRLTLDQPGISPEVNRRASLWYARLGLYDLAFSHALRTDDPAFAIATVETFVDELLWRSQDYNTLSDWFARIPEAALQDSPKLLLAIAWMNVFSGNVAATATILNNVDRAIKVSSPEDARSLLAEWSALQALNRARMGEFDAASYAESAEVLLEETELEESNRQSTIM
ncbi:MAG: AAA family ATPase, partial [Rhodothermales bacterium]|nr:AAA family ATPase [Rhodothermales bacterium]